ncbi:MAG: hypothetical protein GXO46_06050 [Chlorobi bacterium]|nr:hypothetical protein [Chlorobiota bacterium]
MNFSKSFRDDDIIQYRRNEGKYDNPPIAQGTSSQYYALKSFKVQLDAFIESHGY